MAIPFKLNPEPSKRPDDDPFLEFDSERPGVRQKVASSEPLFRSELPEAQEERLDLHVSEPTRGLRQPERTSAISPAVAFAIGVAGLATAATAYYQLSQVLSSRTTVSRGAVAATEAPATAPAPSPVAEQPAGTGRVDVASNPPGATVSLNGVARGLTPYILTGLPAGRHTIEVSRGSFSATRIVELDPGGATAVSVAIPDSGGASTAAPKVAVPRLASADTSSVAALGWLTFDLPIDLLVYQDGRLLGNTRDQRVTLPAGTQDVVLANTEYEYRETVSVTITSGVATRANVALPNGSLSLNALPWADVWVDGSPVGTTPLANLSLPIGSHEVLWRHPTFGDRRQVVIVRAKTPARAGVDFTQ